MSKRKTVTAFTLSAFALPTLCLLAALITASSTAALAQTNAKRFTLSQELVVRPLLRVVVQIYRSVM